MQTERREDETNNKKLELVAFMAPTSSSTEEHSHPGELDMRHNQPPLAGVVKRKRTKRPRQQPPASPASSSESTTTEEEDMAHCLILLAQGQGGGGGAVDSKPSPSPPQQQEATAHEQQQPSPPAPVAIKSSSERYTSRKYTEAATTADGVKAGFYVYECRTCNKCFPTFQALGGHRASHKKPRIVLLSDSGNSKPAPADEIATITISPPPAPPPLRMPVADVTTALSLNSHHHVAGSAASNCGKGGAPRVHECSICGAEFSSGQALGGHMRRHRPLNAPPTAITAGVPVDTTRTKKLLTEGTSVNLELDLNLPPAPSDEEAAAVSTLPPVVLGLGQFNDGNKSLMLTASALVDCHY